MPPEGDAGTVIVEYPGIEDHLLDDPKEIDEVKKMLADIAKLTARWSSDVRWPEVIITDAKFEGDALSSQAWPVKWPIEEANRERLELVDKIIVQASAELKKRGVDRPLEKLLRGTMRYLDDSKNKALALISVRMFTSAAWMSRFNDSRYDQRVVKRVLTERGLLKAKRR